MKISNYGAVRNRLRNDEHDELDRILTLSLEKLRAMNDQILIILYQRFYSSYLIENKIMKPVTASVLTPEIETLDYDRDLTLSSIFVIIEKCSKLITEKDEAEAAEALMPIVHSYKNTPRHTLVGKTGDIWNLLDDVEHSGYDMSADILGISKRLAWLRDNNAKLEEKYIERTKEINMNRLGSLRPVRTKIDREFDDLAQAINIHYSAIPNEELRDLIDEVDAVMKPFRVLLARRGYRIPRTDGSL